MYSRPRATASDGEEWESFLIIENSERGAKHGADRFFDPNAGADLKPAVVKQSHRHDDYMAVEKINSRRSYRTEVHSMFHNPQVIASRGNEDVPVRRFDKWI